MVQKINDIINSKGRIIIKIYSLKYVIEFIDDRYYIYAELYKDRKQTYFSLEELFNNYMIYNEPLIDILNQIIIEAE